MTKVKNKKIAYAIAFMALVAAAAFLVWPSDNAKTANDIAPSSGKRATAPNPPAKVSGFNKNQYQIDMANSLWVIVNKGRALPASYQPQGLRAPNTPLRLSAASPEMQLRPEAAAAIEKMFAAAQKEGVQLMLESGYRSFAEQRVVYNGYVASSGAAEADTFSARPGHSEHQTGLAADIEPVSRHCEVEQCFENTPEGKWLALHAYDYGFVVRYPKGSDKLTGYEYEPWHVRYVGVDLSEQIRKTGQTLEQFFDLPAYQTYPAVSYEIKEN